MGCNSATKITKARITDLIPLEAKGTNWYKLSGNVEPRLKAKASEKLERKPFAHRAFC